MPIYKSAGRTWPASRTRAMDPDRKGISGPHARMSLFATAVVIGHPDRVVSHHAADVHHFDGGAALAVAAASVSSSCTFTCTPFAQTYLVSRAEPGSGRYPSPQGRWDREAHSRVIAGRGFSAAEVHCAIGSGHGQS